MRGATFLTLLALTAPVAAQPVTIDWGNTAQFPWTDGSLLHTYSTGVGNGAVSINVSGPDVTAGRFLQNSPKRDNGTTPGYTGGISPVQSSIFFQHDPTTIGNQDCVITIRFTHPGGVRNVTLPLFDIDSGVSSGPGTFQDQVQALATLLGGAAQNPTSITLGSAVNQQIVAGNTVRGTNNVNPLPTSSAGNATFFFAGPLDQITIVYDDGPTASADPSLSSVNLYNLTFTPVPEPGSLALAGLATGVWAWRRIRRSR